MDQQKGFSLVELMIAITIGVILMTGVVQMFVSSKTVFVTQQGLSRIQETGRLAIEFMSRDIRQAGYMGCTYPTSWNVNSTLNNTNQFGSDFSFDTALRAYESDALPAGMDLDPAPSPDTPVIAVYTANDESVSVSQTNDADNVYVNLTTPPGADCPSGFCAGDIVTVADCDKAWIFQATSVTEVGGGQVALAHAAGADPGNARTVWGGNPDNLVETLDEGAEALKINTVVYYISENDEAVPGLYQQVGGEPAFELLRGVENMNLQIGVDNNSDRIADQYVDFAAVGNWSNAVAARVDVLVQSTDDNVTSEKQTYEFAGEEIESDDRRIRQVFTTTVGVRSKLP